MRGVLNRLHPRCHSGSDILFAVIDKEDVGSRFSETHGSMLVNSRLRFGDEKSMRKSMMCKVGEPGAAGEYPRLHGVAKVGEYACLHAGML